MSSKSDLYLRIGKNLKTFRLQKGFMQIDVAVATDLDRTYISKIETGKARVTIESVIKILKALEISPTDIIEEQTLSFIRDIIYKLKYKNYDPKIS